MERDMRVKGVNGFTLFANYCPACDKLQVHGFWQQLDRVVEKAKWRAVVTYHCRDCGHSWRKALKLTTAKRESRLIDWIDLGFRIALRLPRWIPYWLRDKLVVACLWLNGKVRV